MADKEYLFWIFSLFFIALVTFTVLVNSILLKFSKTLGIRDASETIIRWSPVSKPALGGITFYIVFLITLASFSIFFEGSIAFHNKEVFALVVVTALAFVMGLADDAYNTKPLLKFLVQVLCAATMYFSGVYIKTTPIEWLNIALTLIWIVGIMNSINMLDNMDAISSSTSAGIILMFMLCVWWTGNILSFDFLVLCGVLASQVGFLFHNWHPSKIFMGDTGSQFLGIFLAFFGIKYFWNGVDHAQEIIQSKQFTLVLIGFMVPFIDTTIVVINRISRGQSPFVGGKDHTTHHLSYLGLSDSQVAFVFLAFTSLSLFLVATIVRIIEDWSHLLTLAFWSYFLIVFLVMFIITRKSGKHGKKEDE